MKKTFTLLFSCIFIYLNAQITYTQNDGPQVGKKIFARNLENPASYDLNPLMETGGDKTWDVRGTFSERDTTEFIGVDQLTFKGNFPGCNMAMVDANNPAESYQMFESNSSGYYWLGIHNDMTEYVLNPKFKMIQYPLRYNDNFQNFSNTEYKLDTIDIKIDLQSNSTVDAWGMMTTNDGTFPVIKMKTVLLQELSFAGIPFGSTSFTYNFMASGFANPLVTLDITENENFSGLTTDTSFFYTHKQVVSSEDLQSSNMKLVVLPNPAADFITLQGTALNFNNATFAVINAEGKTVLNGDLQNNESLNLNVQKLVPGNYLFQMILDQKTLLFDIFTKSE